MRKIIVVFGTRPEAIKMCPLIIELKKYSNIETIVCVSGQHKQMLNQVLEFFAIKPDYDFSIMKSQQSLSDITSCMIARFDKVFNQEKPDVVLVHGDTSTAFSAAAACFYNNIALGHIEAGLRTYNIQAPFPEEFNRRVISLISSIDFAPSISAKENLLNEGKSERQIYLTGSTINAAIERTVQNDYQSALLEWAQGYKLVLLTAHRRENIGEPLKNILRAVKRVVTEVDNCKIIFPVHLNPIIQNMVYNELSGVERIKLVNPLNVLDFHNILARANLVLTDSGGVQEEAAILRVPTLIMRNVSERSLNNIDTAQSIIGIDEENIYLKFKESIVSIKQEKNYVKGKLDNGACAIIASIINSYLTN